MMMIAIDVIVVCFLFFKQKTAYEMRISDWSSDVCSSDLVRMAVTPHPFGGLLMVFEDVTDRLSLERSYNTLTAVQQETLDNLYEGIAAFGAAGRLKLINPNFRNQWGLPAGLGDDEPHVGTVLEAMRPGFKTAIRWEAVKAEWAQRTAEPE